MNIVREFLDSRGPCVSTEISAHIAAALNISPQAARQRVSRARGDVKRLAYLPFPRRARFIYLERQFGSPLFWERLTRALLESNSAHGLAIAALQQRRGVMPLAHFAISCGAPLRQSKHLAPETVLTRLKRAGLVEVTHIRGVGECVALIQNKEYYDLLSAELRTRLIAEKILLLAVRDWVRNLGIVSYGSVRVRDTDGQPRVGTFAWDLSAPSYLGCMVKFGRDGKTKPGFVVCDVYLGEMVDSVGVRPFIKKCTTQRTLRNIGPCLELFVAHGYSTDAFGLLKEKGIIPATVRNLFGEDVAEGIRALSKTLQRAAEAAIDPERFDLLFSKLGKIEGASTQLRGTLFEYLTADIARRTISWNVQMNRVFKTEDGNMAEADVIAIRDEISITLIECKGYNPDSEVPDEYMSRWLYHSIPIFYRAIRAHPDWKDLDVKFEFWATGSLSENAIAMFRSVRGAVRPTRYSVKLRLAPKILQRCRSTRDEGLVTTFRKHFMSV